MKQIIVFDGLRFGKKGTPTDSDLCFDISGRTFVEAEFKLEGVEVPEGQYYHLKNKIDALTKGGKDAILFICSHDVFDPKESVIAKDCIVRKFYYNGKLYDAQNEKTFKECAEYFVEYSKRNHPVWKTKSRNKNHVNKVKRA